MRQVVEGQPLNLVEAVAERIAASVLGAHPRVQQVCVAVKKPHVAVPGVVESLGAGGGGWGARWETARWLLMPENEVKVLPLAPLQVSR